MGTATIFGQTYQTIAIGTQEWIARDLDVGTETAEYGVALKAANAVTGVNSYFWQPTSGSLGVLKSKIDADILDGWRLPTEADALAFVDATGVDWTERVKALRDNTGWTTPVAGANNSTGFTALGSGRKGFYLNLEFPGTWFSFAVWPNVGSYAVSLRLTRDYGNSLSYDAAFEYGNSVRLVRDYTPPPPPDITAEAHETTHALALEWTEAADGTPVAYDDGAAYDYIESTITARMTPAELIDLETAWQSSTKLYTIYSTGYLLGPLIDMSAGVEVRLMSYQVDQSADSAMTLYDVTIGVHYGPLSAPSAGSLAVVQSRGRPYHSVAPGAASWITEGGTSGVNAYGRASERSCTWYTHSLTTAQAADVVNALRTIRGSSTTWTAGGVATPWGPSESGTATIWIPEWSVHRESNLLWGVQMELVRNG